MGWFLVVRTYVASIRLAMNGNLARAREQADISTRFKKTSPIQDIDIGLIQDIGPGLPV